jgi:16S rRNA (cytosine1407-C5)-methyltransferase
VARQDQDSGRGEEAFHRRYAELFGERWQSLEEALASDGDSVAFVAGAKENGDASPPYYLDSASVFAASCLEIPAEGDPASGGLVLDACAAPGGKSLVLASRLPPGARLVANELSSDRRKRLREVLDEHLPSRTRALVEVTGHDAAAICCRFESFFDSILLDAPCSSERHVLADPAVLSEWSPSRVKSLAMRQWALLSSALIMLRSGGCLVYSTCSLSPEENEAVISRAAAKYGATLSFDRLIYTGQGEAEARDYGLQILPDRACGAGPMYVCRLHKVLY